MCVYIYFFQFAVPEEAGVLIAIGQVACLIFFGAQAYGQTIVCRV